MSDRNSDITDLSELPPSTTTISTVAVQSGRSKVILAILRVSNSSQVKQGGWQKMFFGEGVGSKTQFSLSHIN